MKDRTDDEKLLDDLQQRLDVFRKAIREKDELQKQLAQVNEKLDEAEAFKSHFIARISNEIINPFTSITTIADNILRSDEQDWEKVKKMTEHIYNEAFFLDFQLRNLFTAARIESGLLEKEIVSTQPVELIESGIKDFKKQMEKKGLKLRKDVTIGDQQKLNTDPEKLKLIIKNLVSNAVKYSKDNSEIRLSATIDDEGLNFTLENEGEQIPEEQQETIFDRFRQLDTRIHSLNPGSGIGLSVCRELAETLEGAISASDTNKGMKFILTIPDSGEPIEGFDDTGDELFFDDSDTTGEIL